MKAFLKYFLACIVCGLLFSQTVSAAGSHVLSCVINEENTEKVIVSVALESGVQSDDSLLYLFAVPTYANGISGYSPIANVAYTGSKTYSLTADLKHNSAYSRLYSKFYVAVKQGGTYVALTGGNFITNPEAVATGTSARNVGASKKGLQISYYIPTDVEDLGIQQGFVNICFEDVLSNTVTNESYIYDGKTYYFTSILENYDTLIRHMTDAGVSVTVALLNEYRTGYEYMIHPDAAPRVGTFNYAVNTSNQEGVKALAAVTHFLAERYNGNSEEYGKVENWVIGNEVNDNLQYNFMGEKDTDTYIQEYLKGFRIMYNAIKSAYSNANVYVPLQNRWGTADSLTDYGGKNFVDKFNAFAKAQGDMDWGLAYHPYSFPANDADILNDGQPTVDKDGNGLYGGEVTDTITTPIITMLNIHLLTNYFHNDELLNADDEVRSIILSEQGYTSYSNITGQNEAKQAANIALAYYKTAMNEDIDAFILRGHGDEDEGSEYFKFGLWYTGADAYPTTQKYAYEMYKYIDTEKSLQYTEFAKAALGIEDWSDVVPGWDEAVLGTTYTRMGGSLYTAGSVSAEIVYAEEMLDVWEKGYNVHGFGVHDHVGNYFPKGLAVTDPNAYYLAYQGIEKEFDRPLSIASTPYVSFDIHFRPQYATDASDKLELRVRFHSGADLYDVNGIINVNTDYKICADLSNWSGASSIDKMEIWIKEYGKKTSFDGTFTLYNLTASANASGLTALGSVDKVLTDLSGAQMIYTDTFDYNGSPIQPDVTVQLNGTTLVRNVDYDVIYNDNINAGTAKITIIGIGNFKGHKTENFTIRGDYPTVYNGVDYSPIYAYGYYKANNPMVVTEVGSDPEAVLRHFVTKGMKYALQGIGSFNVLAYAKLNDDLPKYYGYDWEALFKHYLEFGIYEHRAISGVKPDDMEYPEYPEYVSPTIYNGLDYAAVYNPDYYYNNHPDIAGAFGYNTEQLIAHFVTCGMAEGRQGCAEFNVYAYKILNPDVAAAYGDDLAGCYMHYVLCGKSENRPISGVIPSDTIYNGVDYKDVFNAEYYAQANPDVAGAFGDDKAALLAHFVNCGMAEGRIGSAEFNIHAYKANNPDVAAAFGDDNVSYYMHYINCGKAEGRDATTLPDDEPDNEPSGLDYSLVFDADYYYNNNPDVAGALGYNADMLLQHFVNCGMAEGRVASANFNVTVYKANNGDLQAAFGDDWFKYFEHYILWGHTETHRVCK